MHGRGGTHVARISRVAGALGVEIAADVAGVLAAYVDLVAAWNAKIDLTAARGDDELVDLLVADALVLAARLPEGARVVDVGSGAGAPGLPLSLARADLKMTLVEPLQKRVAFLKTAIGTLLSDRSRPRVLRERGEALVTRGERFDVAISRATLPPPAWAALGAELAERDVWILLARDEPPELPGFRAEDDVAYLWPLTGVARRAVRLVRIS